MQNLHKMSLAHIGPFTSFFPFARKGIEDLFVIQPVLTIGPENYSFFRQYFM